MASPSTQAASEAPGRRRSRRALLTDRIGALAFPGRNPVVSSGQGHDTVRPHELVGSITAVGFSSGNRVVVGNWEQSPIGPFSDVMWAEPDGWRTLFVPNDAVGSFITAIYEFDTVHVVSDLSVVQTDRRLQVGWSEARLELAIGRPVPFPPRNAWMARTIERPLARLAMGVDTHGVSPTGVEESYRARRLRRVNGGWGVAAAHDLGSLGPPRPDCRFGFSEPPPFPSMTELTTYLADPSGRLDEVLAVINSERRGLPSPSDPR